MTRPVQSSPTQPTAAALDLQCVGAVTICSTESDPQTCAHALSTFAQSTQQTPNAPLPQCGHALLTRASAGAARAARTVTDHVQVAVAIGTMALDAVAKSAARYVDATTLGCMLDDAQCDIDPFITGF